MGIMKGDTSGGAPEVGKRRAQELVIRDKVNFLAGFVLTPNALAVSDVATEAKVPMIIMNAATSVITSKSPYVARVSFTLPQLTVPIPQWAAKNGIKKVFILASPSAPAHNPQTPFANPFTPPA